MTDAVRTAGTGLHVDVVDAAEADGHVVGEPHRAGLALDDVSRQVHP